MTKMISAEQARQEILKIRKDIQAHNRQEEMEKVKNFPNTKEYEFIISEIKKQIKCQCTYACIDIYENMKEYKFDFDTIKEFFNGYGYIVTEHEPYDEIIIRWDK